ncbi:MAG TPA: XrtA/PEP-CTERM system exopolysaccharide export protein [Candidatus Competibacteraceae bacterium]|nr:XrtA/PEP-CTERM system exopolysaccharide export protein [Candidatus Competibacteraceae bacterium]
MTGCAAPNQKLLAEAQAAAAEGNYEYIIGPGDRLNIFVWRNPEVSIEGVPVRPDGKISTPLVEEIEASGKTPHDLARDIEKRLQTYIKNPFVTVTVVDFVGRYDRQVRVVGEATTPQALPFRQKMTLLDVMIAVGGLTEFAAGNRATVVRELNGQRVNIPVRLEDLLKDGDISANIEMMPGDILIIPESWF